MARRRLTAIAGALGLVAWLVSSGVTAQADTSPGPDFTYYSLLATYSWSSHNVCYANSGTADNTTIAGTCTITQTTPTGMRNIAVCVQNSSAATADQQCDITQTNDSRNNYALVIQRIQQSTSTTSCPLTVVVLPCQVGTQRASILQTNASGSNFAGVIQTVMQTLQADNDDPTQTIIQHVAPNPSGPAGLTQISVSGSNFAAEGQLSQQSANGAGTQVQTADQFAGTSDAFTDPGDGINQKTGSGTNNSALVQNQKQKAAGGNSQDQTATQSGDITQNNVPGRNLASGNEFQTQLEQAPAGVTHQMQTGGPKCCSLQSGGSFSVLEKTVQQAFAGGVFNPNAIQNETLDGNCDSTGGSCMVQLSAQQQNGAPKTDSCSTSPCHIVVECNVEGCTAFTVCVSCGTAPVAISRLGAIGARLT